MESTFVNFNENFSLNDLTTIHWFLLSGLFYYILTYFTSSDKYIVIVTNLTKSKVKIDKSIPLSYTKAYDHYQKLITKYSTQVYNTFKGEYKIEIVRYEVCKSFNIK